MQAAASSPGPCVQVQVQVSVPTSARQLLRTGETVRSVTVTKPLDKPQSDRPLQQQPTPALSASTQQLSSTPPSTMSRPASPISHADNPHHSAFLPALQAHSTAGPSQPPPVHEPPYAPRFPQARLVSPSMSTASTPRTAAPSSRHPSLQQQQPLSSQLSVQPRTASMPHMAAFAAVPAEAAAAHCDSDSLPPMTRSYLASLPGPRYTHAPGKP